MAIVGSRPTAELQLAIMQQDQAVLVTIPGIGKKLAERVIFELKEKVAAAGVAAAEIAVAGMPASENDVIGALQALGYSLPEAREAARHGAPDGRPRRLARGSRQGRAAGPRPRLIRRRAGRGQVDDDPDEIQRQGEQRLAPMHFKLRIPVPPEHPRQPGHLAMFGDVALREPAAEQPQHDRRDDDDPEPDERQDGQRRLLRDVRTSVRNGVPTGMLAAIMTDDVSHILAATCTTRMSSSRARCGPATSTSTSASARSRRTSRSC